MKIQCELCKEIVPIGSFESSREGIRISCEACGGRFFVAAEAEAEARAEGPGVGAEEGGVCVKCGAEIGEGAEACPACGLRVELFEEFVEEKEEAGSSELRAMWAQCEEAWVEREVHDRFLEAASVAGEYSFAAWRYRAAKRRSPRDPVAAERLAQVSRMAEAALLQRAEQSPGGEEKLTTPYRAAVLVLVALLLFAGAGGAYFMIRAAEAGG